MTANSYHAKCTCDTIEIVMKDEPRVAGHCHCQDCRDLLNVPFHSVNAWEKDKVEISKGSDQIVEYQHPRLNMKKFFCKSCGEVVFNSNGMDWRVFSHHFINRSYNGNVPESLKPKLHFYYGKRIFDVNDDLKKRE